MFYLATSVNLNNTVWSGFNPSLIWFARTLGLEPLHLLFGLAVERSHMDLTSSLIPQPRNEAPCEAVVSCTMYNNHSQAQGWYGSWESGKRG